MQIETSKKYVVEVYRDKGTPGIGTWAELSEFSSHPEALDACKQIVDKTLDQKGGFELDNESLINYYLNFGDTSLINGLQNIATFDPYTHLTNRCNELTARNRLSVNTLHYGCIQ